MNKPGALLAALSTALFFGASAKAEGLLELKVYPSNIELAQPAARARFVVFATQPDGHTRDITALAQIALSRPQIARCEGTEIIAQAAGKAELSARWDGAVATATVTVMSATKAPVVGFRSEVIPILTKAGCNVGSCHGAARGKDGFRLSLFGYDPDGDYQRVTREFVGRRIDRAFPERSLLLKKAFGQVRHTGGKRLEPKSRHAAVLRRWLAEGARPEPASSPRVQAIELAPTQLVLGEPGERAQLVVTAIDSAGRRRDVTSETVFLSNASHCATASDGGGVQAGKVGEAFVMARYGAFTSGCQIIVRGDRRPRLAEPASSPLDALINAKLAKLGLSPAPLCSDSAFLRRATLDIVGRLPSSEELHQFTESPRPDKRAARIDALLEQRGFSQIWVLRLAERLQIRSTRRVSRKATLLYYAWLERKLAEDVPLNVIVRELLTARGGTFSNPATNFFELEPDPLKLAENVAQAFLGMRIQCAQCHNHPFDRWTQDDYYGFAAFFGQLGRKRSEDPRERIIFDRYSGEVRHPVSKAIVAPKLLGGPRPKIRGNQRRRALADWLTSDENPWFAKNMANMIWSHFLGSGVVAPYDDVRVSNPASNPELLEELGRRFRAYRYDFKSLVRDICNTAAYQRSSRRGPDSEETIRCFARGRVRRIKAELLLDVISQVTETREKFRGLPLGARAVEIADGRETTHFLEIFGRPKRESACSCEVKMEPTLSQALHLINGATVSNNIQRGGVVSRLLAGGMTATAVAEELSLRCLARPLQAGELEALSRELSGGREPRAVLEDLFWALLNAREFIFNH